VWAKVAALSFGGPAGQIAVMHRILVEDEKWIEEDRFIHALNYCMLLPGPEAQQLATYVGWLLHGYRGGLVAGALFILPGFLALWGLSALYATYRQLAVIDALFYGLKPAVMAVVFEALLRIGRRSLRTRLARVLAAVAFVAIFFFNVPFPLIVAAAALVGYWNRSWLGQEATAAPAAPVPLARTLGLLALFLVLWVTPVLALAARFGTDSIFVKEGLFFSRMAVVTFGGAYAALAYVAQAAVESFGWLQPGEMLDGLGMAETTPGPLIMVLEFVGFLAAYRDPSGLSPLAAGSLGAIITTWVTFVPCFMFIFLGAPYVERLRGNRAWAAALTCITGAVVGVILNLSVWFALHVLFRKVDEARVGPLHLTLPQVDSLDPVALALGVLAVFSLFRWKLGMVRTLALSLALGFVWKMVFRSG
jgi:chromate transporter